MEFLSENPVSLGPPIELHFLGRSVPFFFETFVFCRFSSDETNTTNDQIWMPKRGLRLKEGAGELKGGLLRAHTRTHFFLKVDKNGPVDPNLLLSNLLVLRRNLPLCLVPLLGFSVWLLGLIPLFGPFVWLLCLGSLFGSSV